MEFMILVLIFFVVTPPCIAYGRNHNNALAITVFSVLLNWSVIGFIVSLIWSCTGNVKKKT